MTLFQSLGFLGSDYIGVGGGTPIFSYIFRFGALFLVQNFRKVIILGMNICGYFFFGKGGGVITKSDFFLGGGGGGRGSFLYILGLFKVKIQNFKYFWVRLIFLFFFVFFWGGGLTVDAGSKPMYEEKLRRPPGVSLGTDLYFYSSLVWRAWD